MTARRPTLMLATVLAATVLVATAGCSDAPSAELSVPKLFMPSAVADYQLAGAYEPTADVTVVVRDASDQPLDGAYSICYINGFQSQPGEQWPNELLLRNAEGDPVIDPNWRDETLLDIRTADNRAAIAERLTPVVAQCAAKGFDAVEFDNLDSYTRSGGVLSREDAIAMATLLVAAGHENALAVAQKNSAELLGQAASDIGFDFVIVEECDQFSECTDFTEVYGDAVINVEYTDDLRRPFSEVCADVATPRTTILRDRNLTPPSSPEYVFEHC